jgi:hypothetical protein
MGSKCYKRGACGKNLQRPCQLVERFPSCNKGLAEDFITNKCIRQSVAGCLTVVRTIKAIDAAGKARDKISKGLFKTLSVQLPSSKGKQSKIYKAVKGKKSTYKNKKNKDKLMADITKSIEPFKHVVPELKKTAATMGKSAKQLRRIFTSESFCTATRQQREQAFARIIPRPNITLKKKASILDGLLIKNAHAASASDEQFYMSYDFAISAGAGLGATLGLSFVTDYRGNGGAYFSIGPDVVTNVVAGGSFGLGFWPKVNQGSFAGWGWGVGVSAGPPTKVVSGSVSIFIDENFKELQGFGFGVVVGAGISPVDLTFGASHAWKL